MEELSHQLRRPGVLRVPGVGDHEIVGAGQPQLAVRQRLVEHDLRVREVDLAVADQRAVHEVQPHRAEVADPLTQPNCSA